MVVTGTGVGAGGGKIVVTIAGWVTCVNILVLGMDIGVGFPGSHVLRSWSSGSPERLASCETESVKTSKGIVVVSIVDICAVALNSFTLLHTVALVIYECQVT